LQAAGGAALTQHDSPPASGPSPANEEIDPAGAPAQDQPGPVDPVRHRRALAWFVAIAVAIIVIDLIVKQLVVSKLADRPSVKLFGGLLYILDTRNAGAAFSLGRNFTWVFPIIAVFVIGWIIWMSRRVGSIAWAVALGLVLGGAAGNLGDRIFRAPGPFRGHVVDMFSVFADNGERFAVFNVADSALTCGVILALLLEFLGRRRDGLPK
jgi:signal peptidase II